MAIDFDLSCFKYFATHNKLAGVAGALTEKLPVQSICSPVLYQQKINSLTSVQHLLPLDSCARVPLLPTFQRFSSAELRETCNS